jgi:hypothetical protein
VPTTPRQASSYTRACLATQQTLSVRQASQPEVQCLLNLALAQLFSFLSIRLTTPHPSSTTFHLYQPQHHTIINMHVLQRIEAYKVSPIHIKLSFHLVAITLSCLRRWSVASQLQSFLWKKSLTTLLDCIAAVREASLHQSLTRATHQT